MSDQIADTEAVLRCPMDGLNGCQAARVGEYLGLLLSTLWLQGEGFSGKRPFGDSGWEYEVYIALAQAGIIDGLIVDEDGYVASFDRDAQLRTDELILQTIKYMTRIDGKVLPLGDEEIAAQEAEEDDPADVWVPKRDRKASDER